MSYAVISKIYRLVEGTHDCEESILESLIIKDYEELVDILEDYKLDYNPQEILVDVKYKGIVEDALAMPTKLVLAVDQKEIMYKDVKFLIMKYCQRKSVIEVIDDKKLCKECFEGKNQLTFEEIKNILGDNTYGMTTADKIIKVLHQHQGKKLTSTEIYTLGKPWNLRTLTPRNSVQARASTLYEKGEIKREGDRYYI